MLASGVSMSVFAQRVLSQEELAYLDGLYHRLEEKRYARYFNLFAVGRRDVPASFEEPMWLSVKEKLHRDTEMTCIGHYFLEYREGGFANIHRDSPAVVHATAISLLYRSDDLQGGEILISQRPAALQLGIELPTALQLESRSVVAPSLKQVSAISVIRQDVGETVWYPAQMMHGVSLVTTGSRRVLVSWYKDKRHLREGSRSSPEADAPTPTTTVGA